MDVFIEKIVARKKTTLDGLISAGIIICGFAAAVAISSSPYLAGFGLLIAVAILYFAFYFVKSRNIEFEYAVTNGELDIDKIIAQRKRKRIFSAKSKDFEIVAKLKSDKYTGEFKNIQKRIEAVTSMDSENVYFLVATHEGKRTVLFFEPDQRMLDNFKVFIPRKVFEY